MTCSQLQCREIGSIESIGGVQGSWHQHRTRLGPIWLLCAGTGDQGRILMLHGFPDCYRTFRHQLPQLVSSGFRCLSAELPGYGLSCRPQRVRKYGEAAVVEAFVEVLESVGPALLLGHDWGAAVAWRIAEARPDLVKGLASVGFPRPRALLSMRQVARFWYIFVMQLPCVPERFLVRRDALERLMAEEAKSPMEARIACDTVFSYGGPWHAIAYYRALGRGHWISTKERSSNRVPTTVILGRKDPYIWAGAAAKGLDEKVVVAGNSGHWPHWDEPGLVTAEILSLLS